MSGRDDLGLSIDMLDADRLRDWARLLLEYGPDISQWGGLPFVVSKMQTIATGIEKAVKDIGVLRESLIVLKDMTEDLEARWDMNNSSTNPGIRTNVERARAVIAKAESR